MKSKNQTAGKTAKKLTFLESITPKENTYVLSNCCGVCKVNRTLVFTDPDGKLVFKRVLELSNGCFMEEDEDVQGLFTTHIAENIVAADDVDYYHSCYDGVDVDEIADEIISELLCWNIDTVQKEDGTRVHLEGYVTETILGR